MIYNVTCIVMLSHRIHCVISELGLTGTGADAPGTGADYDPFVIPASPEKALKTGVCMYILLL